MKRWMSGRASWWMNGVVGSSLFEWVRGRTSGNAPRRKRERSQQQLQWIHQQLKREWSEWAQRQLFRNELIYERNQWMKESEQQVNERNAAPRRKTAAASPSILSSFCSPAARGKKEEKNWMEDGAANETCWIGGLWAGGSSAAKKCRSINSVDSTSFFLPFLLLFEKED